jgi:predicted lactoylglutathione lyase
MKPKRIWANLGVEDLDRTTNFYSQLGLKKNGASKELTSFCFGVNDFIINFFLKKILKSAMKGEITDSQNTNEVVFTLSAESKNQVDYWAKEVEKAGGKVISEPEEFGEGYYGFVFADPDGHRYNVFYMEGMM